MNRRNFLKGLMAAPAVLAFPVLAKTDNSIVFDGKRDYLKTDAFALNEPETIYTLHKPVPLNPSDIEGLEMWCTPESMDAKNNIWRDVSGNGNHLHGNSQVNKPVEVMVYNKAHDKKTRDKIIKHMINAH